MQDLQITIKLELQNVVCGFQRFIHLRNGRRKNEHNKKYPVSGGKSDDRMTADKPDLNLITMTEDEFNMISKNTFDNEFIQDLIEQIRFRAPVPAPQYIHDAAIRQEGYEQGAKEEREKVLGKLSKNVSERISELKGWIKVYSDGQHKCNALAVLGECQAMWAQIESLRTKGEE